MIKLITFFVSVLFACAFANAEELGSWCDTPLPGVGEYDVKFELKGDEANGFALVRTFWDGSKSTEQLIRNGSHFYPTATDGDYYHLTEDGALEVISKGKTKYILKAGSFPKSRSLDKVLSDNSVCY